MTTTTTDLTYKIDGNTVAFTPHTDWGVEAWRKIVPAEPFSRFTDGSLAIGYCLKMHLPATLRRIKSAGGNARKRLSASERAELASISTDDLLAELA